MGIVMSREIPERGRDNQDHHQDRRGPRRPPSKNAHPEMEERLSRTLAISQMIVVTCGAGTDGIAPTGPGVVRPTSCERPVVFDAAIVRLG